MQHARKTVAEKVPTLDRGPSGCCLHIFRISCFEAPHDFAVPSMACLQMTDLQRKDLSPAWKATKPFLNGGLSGMAATCIIQPIDMVKVRIQIGAKGGPVSTFPVSQSSPLCTVQHHPAVVAKTCLSDLVWHTLSSAKPVSESQLHILF